MILSSISSDTSSDSSNNPPSDATPDTTYRKLCSTRGRGSGPGRPTGFRRAAVGGETAVAPIGIVAIGNGGLEGQQGLSQGVRVEQTRPHERFIPCPFKCSPSHPPCPVFLLGARIKHVVEPIVTAPLWARWTAFEWSRRFVLWHAHHLLPKLQTGNRCRYSSFINWPHDE